VLIAVILLGVAGFLVVRGMGIAREREQRRMITEVLGEWRYSPSPSEQQTRIAQAVFSLLKANPKLHDAKGDYNVTPLHLAVFHGNREFAQLLLTHHADANAKAYNGETLLHWAIHHGNKEIATLLLDHGANVNIKDNSDETPLDVAKRLGKQEMVDLLRKHGAKE
jgi:ankyrin repeat protein